LSTVSVGKTYGDLKLASSSFVVFGARVLRGRILGKLRKILGVWK
jgi:hypothetical protein